MKATVYINILVPFEVSDSGYLGTTKSSIDEHIKAAKEHVGRHKVYLSDNVNDTPKLITNAKMAVERVVLEP